LTSWWDHADFGLREALVLLLMVIVGMTRMMNMGRVCIFSIGLVWIAIEVLLAIIQTLGGNWML
jgi:hypothetical protein